MSVHRPVRRRDDVGGLREWNPRGDAGGGGVTRAGRSFVPMHSTPAEPDDLVTFAVDATALGRLRGFLNKEWGT
ncbi:hypothetical protein [Streptomyces sioyaensis]|uniref:hypothetical protein n=1 Tax=Streptomyces sioyaensis TaxID=67364 RepID=UPI00379EB3BF